jgi:hypothetical protein
MMAVAAQNLNKSAPSTSKFLRSTSDSVYKRLEAMAEDIGAAQAHLMALRQACKHILEGEAYPDALSAELEPTVRALRAARVAGADDLRPRIEQALRQIDDGVTRLNSAGDDLMRISDAAGVALAKQANAYLHKVADKTANQVYAKALRAAAKRESDSWFRQKCAYNERWLEPSGSKKKVKKVTSL